MNVKSVIEGSFHEESAPESDHGDLGGDTSSRNSLRNSQIAENLENS